MLAACFSLGLFLFFGIVGTGVLVFLRKERKPNDFLLGPALGIACVSIPTVTLSRLGHPIESFGPVLALVLLAIGTFGLVRARRQLHWKSLIPFGVLLAASFLLTGWPLFKYDFHWLSYANDDMANYANLAQRLLEHGYYEAPSLKQFGANQNFPMFYWFLDDVILERYGVDAVLAWAISVAHLNAFEGFMPTIVALHLCVVSAASGLVYRSARYRPAALLTCLLVACSSLLSFGVDYQLIAQSAGLALACATMSLITELPLDRLRGVSTTLRESAIVIVSLAGLSEVYPEVVPFVVLPSCLYVGYRIIRRTIQLVPALTFAALLAVGWTALLNGYLRNFTWVLFSRVLGTHDLTVQTAKIKALIPLLFPFYLIPTGFANYFGAYPITVYPHEPFLSLGIAYGMLLAALTVYVIYRGVVAGEPIAFVSLVTQLLAIYLFVKVLDFGLYKIAMYSQPFVLGTFAIWWCDTWAKRLKPWPKLARALVLSETIQG